MLSEKPYKVKCLFCGHPSILNSECKSFTCITCYQDNHSLIRFQPFLLRISDFSNLPEVVEHKKNKTVKEIEIFKIDLEVLEKVISEWDPDEELIEYHKTSFFLENLLLEEFPKICQGYDDISLKYIKNEELLGQSFSEKELVYLLSEIKDIQDLFFRVLELILIKVIDAILYFEKIADGFKTEIKNKNSGFFISSREEGDHGKVCRVYADYDDLKVVIQWSLVDKIGEILNELEKRVYMAEVFPETAGLKDDLKEVKSLLDNLVLKVLNLRKEIKALEKRQQILEKLSKNKVSIALGLFILILSIIVLYGLLI